MSKQRTYHIKKIFTNPTVKCKDQAFLSSLVPTGEVTRVIIACVGSKFGSVKGGLCCNHNPSNFTMRK
jgi:hypothetical protein